MKKSTEDHILGWIACAASIGGALLAVWLIPGIQICLYC